MSAPRDRRGFVMFSVMLLTILLVLAGFTILDVVRVDVLLSGAERGREEAREVAEGAVLEVIEDRTAVETFPTLSKADLRSAYQPATSSPFYQGQGRRTYQAAVELVRIVPLSESSIVHTRGVVYEVSAVGEVLDGESQFRSASEVVRPIAIRPGLVLPRRHAR